MINSVTIVGNMGQDPEIRYTPNAVPVASFTVVVNEVYTGKDGQKVKKVHWFRVTAFKRLAEIVGQYCTKGSKVCTPNTPLIHRTYLGSHHIPLYRCHGPPAGHSFSKRLCCSLPLVRGYKNAPITSIIIEKSSDMSGI